ncbi:hypothetical protein LEN26_005568 [Aphanomyces euteiches]|nr:hypothetical protein AeMF1_000347 [Aphanomyces euteiches]KAH9137819.1 hypothetical protein LEN26_005568 [Aphanomyces euteiches]KAH9191925.1 hypothetical protein AeNC1_006093 [Aphanomyces euteiches]
MVTTRRSLRSQGLPATPEPETTSPLPNKRPVRSTRSRSVTPTKVEEVVKRTTRRTSLGGRKKTTPVKNAPEEDDAHDVKPIDALIRTLKEEMPTKNEDTNDDDDSTTTGRSDENTIPEDEQLQQEAAKNGADESKQESEKEDSVVDEDPSDEVRGEPMDDQNEDGGTDAQLSEKQATHNKSCVEDDQAITIEDDDSVDEEKNAQESDVILVEQNTGNDEETEEEEPMDDRHDGGDTDAQLSEKQATHNKSSVEDDQAITIEDDDMGDEEKNAQESDVILVEQNTGNNEETEEELNNNENQLQDEENKHMSKDDSANDSDIIRVDSAPDDEEETTEDENQDENTPEEDEENEIRLNDGAAEPVSVDEVETEEEDEAPQVVENDEDEDDVEALVNMALSSFQNHAPTETSSENTMVANKLNSGVRQRDLYLNLQGKNCSKGAQLVPERKIVEELKAFAKTQASTKLQDHNNAAAHGTKADSGRNRMSGKWFNMVSNEMTAEAKRDIQLIKMRNYLDPKRFYKSSDHRKSNMPKVFQVGTVIEGAAEFKSARLSRKERHQTFTEEILHDQQIRNYTKRKFNDIQATRANSKKSSKKPRK